MNIKEELKKIIENIEKENYSYKFESLAYSYSDEITDLFKVLDDERIRKIFDDNCSKYSYDIKKELDQKKEPESYSLIDCVMYFNWIWHLEAGIAVGIVLKRIKEGKYLRALKRFYELV
jgi:hypothetical protein